MRWKFLLITLFFALQLWGKEGIYSYDYMSKRTGVIPPNIGTGLTNYIDGRALLRWRGEVIHLEPVFFNGTDIDDKSIPTLENLEQLLSSNGSRVRYVALIGHSSSAVTVGDEVAHNGWVSFWQRVGGKERMDMYDSIRLVNNRLETLYNILCQEMNYNPKHIYTENRVDRDPLSTEATKEGKALNNRVDIMLFCSTPVRIRDLHIRFALDSDRILPAYRYRVKSFAKMLKSNKKLKVTIIGHTDKQGSYDYNIKLSKKRAEAVKRALVSYGVSPSKISTVGKGYTEPVDSRNTQEAYKKNRRIEAVLR